MRIAIKKHLAIIGETQSGKTVLAREIFNANPTKSLFIDIEDLGEIHAERELNMNDSPKTFRAMVQHYSKVKYVPSSNPSVARKETRWIWRMLMNMNINICVFADEIQNYGDDKRNVFDVYAVRGLKHGVHLITISQRPAYVSKTIMAQTPKIVFFNVGTFESEYFKRYRLPYEEINTMFAEAPEYSFIIYERGRPIEGPFRLLGVA